MSDAIKHAKGCAALTDRECGPCTCDPVVPTAPHALTREQVVDKLVDKFLSWPLPDSVCSDLCATKQGYPHRSGTTLLAEHEAKKMFEHVLTELFEALTQQAQEIESTRELNRISAVALSEKEQEVEQAKRGEAYCLQEKERILSEFCLLQVKYGEQKHEIRNLTQEVERLKVELEECRRQNGISDREMRLERQLAAMTAERDAWQKSAQQYNGTYESLQQQFAASQAKVMELEAEHKAMLADAETVKELWELDHDHYLQERNERIKLQATLATRERDIKGLEHEAMQEGEQFRQFAQEIITPTMRVADTGPISFGKLKEVVEAAIHTARQDAARLRELLALSKCGTCDGSGWYQDTDPMTGGPVQAQCRYCFNKSSGR